MEQKFAKAKDVVFMHLQTVWEGTQTNTPERGPPAAKRHGVTVPVGFDGHIDGARLSTTMATNGTGGTPWTVVRDAKGVVRFNNFTGRITTEAFTKLIEKLRKEAKVMKPAKNANKKGKK